MSKRDLPQLLDFLEQVKQAAADSRISATAADNIIAWLIEPRYAEYAPEVVEHIAAGKWQILDDVFWTVIPFGTGGRRGRMYPIGSNAINDRTIGESAQGLADYVKDTLGSSAALSCAIAYDTRHRSQHFARLCAEIMTAAGFTVCFLQGPRSTPELSFAVRYKNCSCGIMVTASHNPPSDNAVKVYWSTGGQVAPPHDTGIIERVMSTQDIGRSNFDEMLAAGKIILCQDEVDAKFQEAVLEQATPGPRDLKVIYSPLHGVGATAVLPVLAADGFADVEVFGPHAEPDGDFPNVPGHVANPENSAVFDAIMERGCAVGADIALATDPDCDRIGIAAPLTAAAAPWRTLTGNQIGALLADFILENRRASGDISAQHFIVQTLVTTQLVRRIADSYGVRTVGNLLVGFKWIAEAIDKFGPKLFLYGTEESHGYLAGSHVRDKDGAVAALLACELAARLKVAGQTLHEKLDALFWQHGVHAERTVSVQMPGSEGMARMREVMTAFRSGPPSEIAGERVVQVRDYESQTVMQSVGPPSRGGQSSGHGGDSAADSSESAARLAAPRFGPPQSLEGPRGDLVFLDMAIEGNYVACRPSGTEPKIKFYMFTYTPPEQLANLGAAKQQLEERLDRMEADLRKFAGV